MSRKFTTIAVAAALLVIVPTGARAQSLGFKLGGALADMSSDAAGAATERIAGFTGGGYVRLGVVGWIGLQAEVLSSSRGADFVGTSPLSGYNYRMDYVEVPLLLFLPLSSGMVAPYAFAGPSAGFEVRCRVTLQAAGGDVEPDSERDCDDVGAGSLANRRSPDFSLVAGGGVAFAMGPGNLLVEGRYTAGMRSITRNGDTAPDLRHRAFSVMAAYEIPLARRW